MRAASCISSATEKGFNPVFQESCMKKQVLKRMPEETQKVHAADFEKEKKKLEQSFKKKEMPFRLFWVK